MRTVKKILLLLLSAVLLVTPFTSAADEGAYVFLDGEEITLSGAAAYFDTDIGIIMASMDLFSEKLGVEVNYSPETGTVLLSHKDTVLTFTVDDTEAKLNSRNVTLDTPPVLKEGTVYVPLRFAAENLGFELTWNADEKRVDLATIYDYELGIPREKMVEIYGTPSGTMPSEKGYEWQVYQTDYTDYQLIGLDAERVVAYYVSSETWKLPFGVQYGTKLSSCQAIMNGLGYQSSSGSGYTTYTSKESTLTVYYQETGEKPIYAALFEYTSYASNCTVTPSVLSAMERTLADLTNVMRVREGLEPLMLDRNVSAVAKAHSNDMAENDFFAHTGTDGMDKTGRMEAAGYGPCYISEALSKAYPNSFAAFASFYSNAMYQEILSANFDLLGIGYSYNPDSEGVLYCVQLFYAEKD